MLSKSSALVLGIIAERPVNPYEITKMLDFINIENWFSMGVSSVYATIKNLQAKKLICGVNIKEGNMPEKTIYSITSLGRNELTSAIEAFLISTDLDFIKFNISIILLCHLPQDQALELARQRAVNLKSIRQRQLLQLEKLQGIPALGIQAIQNTLNIANAHIQSTEELLQIITNDVGWNHFMLADNISYI